MSTTAGSKLNVLRGRLAALRRARQSVRWGAAYSASATAVLWLLAGVWALDVAFSTSVAQRGVMLLIVVAGAVWSYSRWTLPLLGVSESEVDLALLVERQHRLDSDLVAALQFESPDASEWGSRQLEQAVIDRVANLGQTLDVFTGFSREQLKRRGGTLGVTVAGLALIAAIFPGHAGTFLNRLLLGHKHYPTRTQIARVAINDQLVLDRHVDDTSPRRMAAPQGQLLKFYLRAEGRLPTNASARVQSLSGGVSRHVDLVPMTLDERRSRLQAALARTAQVAPTPTDAGKQPADNATSAGDAKPDDSADSVKPVGSSQPDGDAATSADTQPTGDKTKSDNSTTTASPSGAAAAPNAAAGAALPPAAISAEGRDELLAVMQCDAPLAAEAWLKAEEARGSWQAVRDELQKTLDAWPKPAEGSTLLVGELGRLVDSIRYKLYAGDAWTDPAELVMTPRPSVELRYQPTPPAYARRTETVRELGPRQLSVLERTQVDVGIQVTNGKPLKEAWLSLKTPDGVRRIELARDSAERARWQIPAGTAPFDAVRSDLRFEVQVRDEDGLTLETPLAGLIRIKPDRPPLGAIDVVHRVVLPNAKPAVQYRAMDDYGIAKLLLHMEVERPQNDGSGASSSPAAGDSTSPNNATDAPPASTVDTSAARQTVSLLEQPGIVVGDRLPLNGRRDVPLAALQLAKGQRLKLTLEVVDDRGDAPGESYLSEPLFLEISDEAGVLSAILEADERSEQRLNDIIKRQLGIREAP